MHVLCTILHNIAKYFRQNISDIFCAQLSPVKRNHESQRNRMQKRDNYDFYFNRKKHACENCISPSPRGRTFFIRINPRNGPFWLDECFLRKYFTEIERVTFMKINGGDEQTSHLVALAAGLTEVPFSHLVFKIREIKLFLYMHPPTKPPVSTGETQPPTVLHFCF
jgi:hypothetical protein